MNKRDFLTGGGTVALLGCGAIAFPKELTGTEIAVRTAMQKFPSRITAMTVFQGKLYVAAGYTLYEMDL